jgi:hypothetical protein
LDIVDGLEETRLVEVGHEFERAGLVSDCCFGSARLVGMELSLTCFNLHKLDCSMAVLLRDLRK